MSTKFFQFCLFFFSRTEQINMSSYSSDTSTNFSKSTPEYLDHTNPYNGSDLISHLPNIIRESVFNHLDNLYEENIFELYLLAKHARKTNEISLFGYIQEYLNRLEEITFSYPEKEYIIDFEQDCHTYIRKLMSVITSDSKLYHLEINGLPERFPINFPLKVKPNSVLLRNISLRNLEINALNINTLCLSQIKYNQSNSLHKLLSSCTRLTTLKIEDFDTILENISKYKDFHLEELKITGKIFRQDSITKLSSFINIHAKSLRKLTLKSSNQRNLIYKMNTHHTEFKFLNEINTFIPDSRFGKIPNAMLLPLENIKFYSEGGEYEMVKYHLYLLEKYENIKNISFKMNKIEIDQESQIKLISHYPHLDTVITIR